MKKYIFLHNPKCAGTSIHSILPGKDWHNLNAIMSQNDYSEEKLGMRSYYGYESKPHHFSIEQHMMMRTFDKEEFKKAYKFTFVRNPYDRVVSAYHYSQDTSDQWGNLSFEEFVDIVKEIVQTKSYYKWQGPLQPNHVSPQHLYAYKDDKKIVNFIGKCENFDSVLKVVLKKLKLEIPQEEPKINTTPEREHYKKYYNDRTIKIIEDLYKEDIELFGYRF
jgi:hypothetical protein